MIIVTGCCLKFAESELSKPAYSEKTVEPETASTSNKSVCERRYVEISNSSYVPNCQIEAYLGQVNLFFIRESKSQ